MISRFKIYFFIPLFLIFFSFSSINLYSQNSNSTSIVNLEYEPENFDEEYIHDEIFISQKIHQLKDSQQAALLSGAFEELDNIILQNALMNSFEVWKGTRYLWGGDSLNGIDCSALTRRIFRDVFKYELPRVSVDQTKHGIKVDTSNLKPGDILFFRPRNSVNHTAVYLGNSLFINASSSKGVVLSSLNNSYWSKYFKYGVRVHKARNV